MRTDRLALWSKASGLDLVRLGTTATAEEITDTAVTQPLVVAAALLAFEELDARGSLPADTIVAGHSVGELAAAAVAGVISADDAVALAAIRGAEMAKACALEPTGMSAVLGGDEAAVLARLDELGLDPGQPQRGGPDRRRRSAGRARGTRREPAGEGAGSRAARRRRVPHRVHGSGAGGRHRGCVARSRRANPTRTLLSNFDGAAGHLRAPTRSTKLAAQVTRPVRWDLCTANRADRPRSPRWRSCHRPAPSSVSPSGKCGHADSGPQDPGGHPRAGRTDRTRLAFCAHVQCACSGRRREPMVTIA